MGGPTRAEELAKDALTGFAWPVDGRNPVNLVAEAIRTYGEEVRKKAVQTCRDFDEDVTLAEGLDLRPCDWLAKAAKAIEGMELP